MAEKGRTGGLILVASMAGMWCGGDSRFNHTLPPLQRLGAEIKNFESVTDGRSVNGLRFTK
jgi:hypothetical protein